MKEWKYLVHFRYVFFYEHIFCKLYICVCVQEKFNIMINKIFNERRNNASTILTTSSRVYTKSHLSN
jgi:hypothetical protein